MQKISGRLFIVIGNDRILENSKLFRRDMVPYRKQPYTCILAKIMVYLETV
jgi:hypothetical protein